MCHVFLGPFLHSFVGVAGGFRVPLPSGTADTSYVVWVGRTSGYMQMNKRIQLIEDWASCTEGVE